MNFEHYLYFFQKNLKFKNDIDICTITKMKQRIILKSEKSPKAIVKMIQNSYLHKENTITIFFSFLSMHLSYGDNDKYFVMFLVVWNELFFHHRKFEERRGALGNGTSAFKSCHHQLKEKMLSWKQPWNSSHAAVRDKWKRERV